MLFACVVKPGEKVAPPSDQGAIIHLSQACLNNPKNNTTTYLQITNGEATINLCALAKDKCEHASFDLFFPTDEDIQFSVKGPHEIHVAGYFEPEGDTGGYDLGDDEEESDEEAEEASDDGGENENQLSAMAKALPGKKVAAMMPDKAAKKAEQLAELMASLKGGKTNVAPESDEDEDDDDDDEDDDGEDDGEENDVEMEALMNAVKTSAAAKALANAGGAPAQQPTGVKRKSAPETTAPTPQPPKKQTKKGKDDAPTAVVGGDDNSKFEKALVDYVKAHGRTSISNLGSQVKKPTTVKKLGAFIKERQAVFKVDNGFVSLVA